MYCKYKLQVDGRQLRSGGSFPARMAHSPVKEISPQYLYVHKDHSQSVAIKPHFNKYFHFILLVCIGNHVMINYLWRLEGQDVFFLQVPP